jgi:hypothetical protein
LFAGAPARLACLPAYTASIQLTIIMGKSPTTSAGSQVCPPLQKNATAVLTVMAKAPVQTTRLNHRGVPDSSSSLYRQALMRMPSPRTAEHMALRKDMGARACQA